MDTFMCSSWYFLRYTSPGVDKHPFDKAKLRHWMPVDLYTGGAEHAVMHLLYSRFFIKAIRDMGLVNFGEPFIKLFNQGTIIYQGDKMSKSRGNVVTPDVYVSDIGADAVRAYLMFIGPWELGGEWSDQGIVGMSRWMNRVWNLVTAGYSEKKVDPDAEKELSRLIHQTIKKVTGDMERFRFNTMLAALMEFTNYLGKIQDGGTVSNSLWNEAVTDLLLLLAPTAPHLTEELWEMIGHTYSIHNQAWPKWDEELVKEEEVTLVIQVNGKVRDKITVPVSITEAEATELALGREKIKAYVKDNNVTKIIYVPQRLVNIVMVR
jgi:leucyl-tRNA synthetase